MNFLGIQVPLTVMQQSGFLSGLYDSMGANPDINNVFYGKDITEPMRILINKLVRGQLPDRANADEMLVWDFLCMK